MVAGSTPHLAGANPQPGRSDGSPADPNLARAPPGLPATPGRWRDLPEGQGCEARGRWPGASAGASSRGMSNDEQFYQALLVPPA